MCRNSSCCHVERINNISRKVVVIVENTVARGLGVVDEDDTVFALISNAALLYMSLYAARQFAARREALRALEEANESLERRVSERTAELQHYQGHLEDMVHARTLELAQARDDAEAASRAKSALLANMTHELRTPLHQISGLVLILQRRIEDEKQKSSLDKIGGAARRLQTLLENILELARVESGRVVIESKPFAPAMLLTDAVNRWQAEAARKAEERLKYMTFYSTTQHCLRGFLLQYFGEAAPKKCGNCSCCLAAEQEAQLQVEYARRRAAQSADRLEKPRRAKPAAAGSLSEADEKLLNALYAVRKRLAGKDFGAAAANSWP